MLKVPRKATVVTVLCSSGQGRGRLAPVASLWTRCLSSISGLAVLRTSTSTSTSTAVITTSGLTTGPRHWWNRLTLIRSISGAIRSTDSSRRRSSRNIFGVKNEFGSYYGSFFGCRFQRLSTSGIAMAAQPLILRLVASSVRIADRAGTIVRNIMKAGNLGIVDKGINDLQTEADRSVQRCIVASLNAKFPKIAVFGEEDKDVAKSDDADWVETELSEDVLSHAAKFPGNLSAVTDEDICIWVDPLDGTAEYTQGLLDHVTVLIGIAVKGEAVAGVIHQPYYNYQLGPDAKLGRTIWGIIGLGSYGFEPKAANPDERIIVTTRSHETEAVRNAIAACQPTNVLKVGGAGHKVLLLIEGKAHAYIFASPGCKKWDTCGPEAVLRAIGGSLTDVHGKNYRYGPTVHHPNTGGVIATVHGQPHEWFLSKIPDEIKEKLPTD